MQLVGAVHLLSFFTVRGRELAPNRAKGARVFHQCYAESCILGANSAGAVCALKRVWVWRGRSPREQAVWHLTMAALCGLDSLLAALYTMEHQLLHTTISTSAMYSNTAGKSSGKETGGEIRVDQRLDQRYIKESFR